MPSSTKSRDPRKFELAAAAVARNTHQSNANASISEETRAPTETKVLQKSTTGKSDAQCQTPDRLPRAPWLAGPGPIDCVILRLPNTELFAHRVTFSIQQHGIRTNEIVVTKQQEITPYVESLRRSRESLYAVIIDDKNQAEELIEVHFLLSKDTVLQYVEYRAAIQQIGDDFAKLKDTPWNRQRIMRFFLDPMLEAIEPTLEHFSFFKNYLKRGLRG